MPCVFVLVHDSCQVDAPDPMRIFREMQAKFAPLYTRLLMINSMPPVSRCSSPHPALLVLTRQMFVSRRQESPNTQQPDLWSPHLNALFFPREVPDEALLVSPTHSEARQTSGEYALGDLFVCRHFYGYSLPLTGCLLQPVLCVSTRRAAAVSRGTFLSPEDLMALREFVADICRAHILPLLERRLLTLNHAVTSARKGVRNALKSWWRKPREETGTSPRLCVFISFSAGLNFHLSAERVGEVLYRYDKIESQIRLLADTLFLCKVRNSRATWRIFV